MAPVEMQSKPGPNGTPGTFPSPTAGTATATVVPSDPMRLLGIVLRGAAIVLTLIAAILMGVAKQTVLVLQTDDFNNLVAVPVTVKSTYSSAFVYFIAANVIAFFFSSVSLALSAVNRSSFANLPLLSIFDLVTSVLLFSSNSAAIAIDVVMKNGIDRYGWGKLCVDTNKFCGVVTAAVVLSMMASLAYLLLLLLTIIGFHKRSQ